ARSRSRPRRRPAHGAADRLDRSLAGHGDEHAATAVPVEQRRRLPRVHAEPVAHGRLAVVLTLVELAAAAVADAGRLRGRPHHVGPPVATCGTPHSRASSRAWVPLPAPGGPRKATRTPQLLENAPDRVRDFLRKPS